MQVEDFKDHDEGPQCNGEKRLTNRKVDFSHEITS